MDMHKIKILICLILMASFSGMQAQQSECKVMMESISGSYSGKCKNGLAQGKGIAQGTDHYQGQFNKGLPNGMGVYTWADGTFYDGQWKNGLREGKGKMVYQDSVIIGYWRTDRYVGDVLLPPYKVTQAMSVTRHTFTRTSSTSNGLRIRITQAGTDNVTLEDFSMAYNSGEEYRSGSIIGIQNVRFPVEVVLKYRTWNTFHTQQHNVIFAFTISEPGTWEIMITN
jgi:hypothetical protein